LRGVTLSQAKARGNLAAANAALLSPDEDGLTLKNNSYDWHNRAVQHSL
jgi:hypothetical protein